MIADNTKKERSKHNNSSRRFYEEVRDFPSCLDGKQRLCSIVLHLALWLLPPLSNLLQPSSGLRAPRLYASVSAWACGRVLAFGGLISGRWRSAGTAADQSASIGEAIDQTSHSWAEHLPERQQQQQQQGEGAHTSSYLSPSATKCCDRLHPLTLENNKPFNADVNPNSD